MTDRISGAFLLVAVFAVAICGLVYELLAATVSSYLLGASVTQFSLVIGLFLTAMGLGSYATKFVQSRLVDAFLAIQIGIGLVGGISAAILLITFAVLSTYLPILIGLLAIVGALVGMEIPLIIRILKSRDALRVTVANVLALDYLGALFASVAFPLVLVPYLGLLRTGFVFGLINVAVAAVGLRVLAPLVRRRRLLRMAAGGAALVLCAGLIGAGHFTGFTENQLYQDEIIFTAQTKYQRLVVTRWHDDIRLYIDGNLQFSSVDEHRYHETLVHPAVAACPGARRVLILGGGDGMAARELLKYPRIERIDLVDLDAAIIEAFSERPFLSRLSGDALGDPRVQVHVADAVRFLQASSAVWDMIVMDLPDPNSLSLGRLYTTSFFTLCGQHLAAGGVLVTQATSPFYAPEAFWCIAATLQQARAGPEGIARLHVRPYHAYVPSFGDWGFIMASRRWIDPADLRLQPGLRLRFLTDTLLPSLFLFPPDTLPKADIEPNRLNDQILVTYYRRGWRRYGP
jgi:spermidine synthase